MSDVEILIDRLAHAYWPRPHLNESALRSAGDAIVDEMSLEQLAMFFDNCKVGPLHCMVKSRFRANLKQYFQEEAIKAAQEAKAACDRLAQEVKGTITSFLEKEEGD